MKTKAFFVILTIYLAVCWVMPTFAQDMLIFEYHNEQKGWVPRIGALIEPISRLHFFLRKGIGGPDPTLATGYDISLGKYLVFTPYFGSSTDDNLNMVYIAAEPNFFIKYKTFKSLSVLSFGIPVSDQRENTIYLYEKTCFQFGIFSIGVLSDYLLMDDNGYKEIFWKIGPTFSYQMYSQPNIDFTFYTGWEHKNNHFFVRPGISVRF